MKTYGLTFATQKNTISSYDLEDENTTGTFGILFPFQRIMYKAKTKTKQTVCFL